MTHRFKNTAVKHELVGENKDSLFDLMNKEAAAAALEMLTVAV